MCRLAWDMGGTRCKFVAWQLIEPLPADSKASAHPSTCRAYQAAHSCKTQIAGLSVMQSSQLAQAQARADCI